jgi:bifunctional UDP-N-acetylglucosamine pyrophosphorylase/glucosamine-1-phosphate N-acetyltransferase
MQAVILAAGESSRFKPLSDRRHKGLTEILGKPVIEHTADELRDAGADEIIVVESPEDDIGGLEGVDRAVVQEEPLGMGNALRQAEHLLEDSFMVATPYRANASRYYDLMMEKSEEYDTVFLASETDKPEKYGILDINSKGKAVDIVEKPDRSEAPSNMKAVGLYLLNESIFDYLDEVEQKEYQFEEALSRQLESRPAGVVETEESTNSIKYPWDLFEITRELLDNSSGRISDKAKIANSAEIKGKVIVEDNAEVMENAVVKGPAYIGESSIIGNNAVVREYSCIEREAVIGANAEVRNSIFQPEASMHSGFVGDSVIGRNSSIGAGTVIANRRFRDGENRPEIATKLIEKEKVEGTSLDRLGAFIGENVDIGVNVSIMPGVQIGSEAKVFPGSVVTENIEEKSKYGFENR